MDKWTAFILGFLLAISIIIGWSNYFTYANRETDCTKFSTQAILINNELKDVEFCELPQVEILKVY